MTNPETDVNFDQEAMKRLTIQIVHRDGFDQPIDECEIRCLKEMKEQLKEIGVRAERW